MALETEYTDYPICPHCGYEHKEVWEWDFGPGLDGDVEGVFCDSCGQEFFCSRSCTVTYSTKKPADM